MLELINELCISIDADMREQRKDLLKRQRFVITKTWVAGLERCPDWPPEAVAKFDASQLYAADVAEMALRGDRISLQDAVWLLLQAPLLPVAALHTFAVATAEVATCSVAKAVWGLQHEPGTRAIEDFRDAELQLRAFVRFYSQTKQERTAQLLLRLSRIYGLVVSIHDRPQDAHKLALKLHALALRCGRPQVELRRQLCHLHALVT